VKSLNKRIQRLNSRSCPYNKALLQTSLSYFFNIQHVEIDIQIYSDNDKDLHKNVPNHIMEILRSFKSMNTLLILFYRVILQNEDNYYNDGLHTYVSILPIHNL